MLSNHPYREDWPWVEITDRYFLFSTCWVQFDVFQASIAVRKCWSLWIYLRITADCMSDFADYDSMFPCFWNRAVEIELFSQWGPCSGALSADIAQVALGMGEVVRLADEMSEIVTGAKFPQDPIVHMAPWRLYNLIKETTTPEGVHIHRRSVGIWWNSLPSSCRWAWRRQHWLLIKDWQAQYPRQPEIVCSGVYQRYRN